MTQAIRFRDRQGFLWHAVELSPPEVPSQRSLYFFSGGSTRRLTEFADDWADSVWSELDTLKDRARPLSTDVSRSAELRRNALEVAG